LWTDDEPRSGDIEEPKFMSPLRGLRIASIDVRGLTPTAK
jgi:hypothetical protein